MPTANAHKRKIERTRFSIYQKVALENSFLSSLYLTGVERDNLAFKLGLSPVTVQVNRLPYILQFALGKIWVSWWECKARWLLKTSIFCGLTQVEDHTYYLLVTFVSSFKSLDNIFFSLNFYFFPDPFRPGSRTDGLNGAKNSRWQMATTRSLSCRHHHCLSSPIHLLELTENPSWGLSTSNMREVLAGAVQLQLRACCTAVIHNGATNGVDVLWINLIN